jgi:hypothetical protein
MRILMISATFPYPLRHLAQRHTVTLVTQRSPEVSDDDVTAIGHLFDQPALRATLAQRGRELIEATFTWERAGQAYDTVLTA